MTDATRFPLARRVIGTAILGVTGDIDQAMETTRDAIAAYDSGIEGEGYDNLIGARLQVRRLTFSADVISALEGQEVAVPTELATWAGLDQSRTQGDAERWCSWRLNGFAGVTYPEWQAALSAPDGLKRLTGLMALIDELPEEMLDLKQFDGDRSGIETLRKAMRREAVSLVASEQHLVHILELWDAAVTALPGDDAIAA